MRIRGLLAVTVVMVLLVASTAAMAAVGEAWTPPMNLSDWLPSIRCQDYRLDLGDDGTLLATWVVMDTSNATWSLWARVRLPGQEWQPAENLSGWQQWLGKSLATRWGAAVGPDGTAWVLWVAIDSAQSGDNQSAVSARRPPGPGTSWQLTPLHPGYESYVSQVGLHVGPDGDLAAIWVACTDSVLSTASCHVRLSRRAAGASAWTVAENADNALAQGISEAYVVVGPGGLTVVIWSQADAIPPTKWAALARAYDPQGKDPSPANVSGWKATLELGPPVIDPGGTVTAAWLATSADPSKVAHYANTRQPQSGTWNPAPSPLSTALAQQYSGAPELVLGQNGTVAASWLRQTSSETYLYANARDAGQPWSGEQQVAGGPGIRVWTHNLAIWPGGAIMAIYYEEDTSRDPALDSRGHWSVRLPGGVWGGGGQDQLGGWVASISDSALKLALDGSGAAVWNVKDAARPVFGQYSVSAAIWPPGGPFGPPAVLSDWVSFTCVRPEGLAVGKEGRPVATAWTTLADAGYAVFYSELGPGGLKVYLPLVLQRLP
jgi:hypothetical protein